MYKVKDIVNRILEVYPLSLGSEFDKGKIGLQFGNMNADVTKVMVTLDTTLDVIDEAIENGCNMIISHHPFMFQPLLNVSYESPLGKKLAKIFKNDLNIFAMHTNFDSGLKGMNDLLLEKIGLNNIHSTEEVAMADCMMRFGETSPMTLKEFAIVVKDKLNEPSVKIVGDENKIIKKVAIIGGGGAFDWPLAMRSGVDCYITGELRHNNMIDAIENHFAMIEVSHFAESNCKDYFKEFLLSNFSDLEVLISKKDVCPFKVL